LWWTKWHWGSFSPSTSVSLANSYSTDCSTIITIIYHLVLVQQAKHWLKYEVDSVSRHEKKEEEEKKGTEMSYPAATREHGRIMRLEF
jgi:hypothetical protein